MALNKDKNLKLYYSIGEIAELFNVSETLLRYWEREFPQIKPKKAGRNIRQYSQKDIDEIKLVYHLVKERGLKIAAARSVLKQNKEGTQQTMEVVKKLQNIKVELIAIKNELSDLA